MKRYLLGRKELVEIFSFKERLSALMGSLLLSTFIMIPIFVAVVEALIIYMYLVYEMTCVIIVLVILYEYFIFHFNKKAYELKNPEVKSLKNIKFYLMINVLLANVISVLIGLLFIFVWIPNLLV